MTRLGLLLAAVWVVLALIVHDLPTIAGPAVGAGVGATVSFAVYVAGRLQGRRSTTLDLFKEYYSAKFAAERRAASAFMRNHPGVDWSRNNPYVLGADDANLGGYGAVLRYWHRVAVLHREHELDRSLAERLLSRELGEWNAKIFEPMATRRDMYVLDLVADLSHRFSFGSGGSSFSEGRRDALSFRIAANGEPLQEHLKEAAGE